MPKYGVFLTRFSRIRTEFTTLFLCEKIRDRENPYSSVFYAVKDIRKVKDIRSEHYRKCSNFDCIFRLEINLKNIKSRKIILKCFAIFTLTKSISR